MTGNMIQLRESNNQLVKLERVDKMKKLKVVFHINDTNRWPILLSNIKNLVKDLGEDNISIKVIANGMAVLAYIPEPDNERILRNVKELSEIHVTFMACRNSLTGNNIDEKTLPSVIEIVPAGVTELVKKQAEGFGYIKP